MYFLKRGVVQVSRFINFIETPVVQLSEGKHFGEAGLRSKSGKYNANVVALVSCDLQELTKTDFEALAESFREFRTSLQKSSISSATSGATGVDALVV